MEASVSVCGVYSFPLWSWSFRFNFHQWKVRLSSFFPSLYRGSMIHGWTLSHPRSHHDAVVCSGVPLCTINGISNVFMMVPDNCVFALCCHSSLWWHSHCDHVHYNLACLKFWGTFIRVVCLIALFSMLAKFCFLAFVWGMIQCSIIELWHCSAGSAHSMGIGWGWIG